MTRGGELLYREGRKVRQMIDRLEYAASKRALRRYMLDLSIEGVNTRYADATERWQYYHHYFWHLSPDWLRAHR